MKTWQSSLLQTLLGFFLGVIALAGIYLVSRPPQGTPVQLLPVSTPAPLVVQVSGEVQKPALYTLARGSRVQDVVMAAGGLTVNADQAALNLAAPLKDGEKVVVPTRGTAALPSDPGEERTSKQPVITIAFPIDLNTATLEELDALPGIGPERAQDILRYREEHDGFKNIEEIKEVKGIGDATFDQLKGQITVNTNP